MAATVHGRKIILVLLSLCSLAFADDCKVGKYSLKSLDVFSPWYAVNLENNITFQISLCGKLAQNSNTDAQNCPDGTAICATYSNGSSVSFGNFDSDTHTQDPHGTEPENIGQIYMMFTGEKVPTSENDESFYSVFIFKCGKTLGNPHYLGDIMNSAYFEWESYIFCENLPVPDKEVPCSIVKHGHEIDLSPLTKLTGAYLVDEDEEHNTKIFINVCRQITAVTAAEDELQKCPQGSGACRVVNNEAVNFGFPSHGLEVTDSGVKLVYTATDKPSGCLDKPSATINFRCPERGGSKDPVLLSDFLVTCSMEIEWVTEFACPVDYITSKSCLLTKEQHDIDIDLSPLRKPPFSPYVVNVTDRTGKTGQEDHYIYYINVCDSLGTQCGEKAGVSVCQKKVEDPAFHRRVGMKETMQLSYSDGQLTLSLRHGDPCSSHFNQATLIDFFCNKTAVNDGTGYPEFVRHDNCSYIFHWETKYACLDHSLDDTCRVNVDGKRFDLSSMVKENGENWQVITGENEEDKQNYFVNVCHDTLITGEAANCPPGTAVCRTGTGGPLDLGHYTQPLQYDKASHSLRLNYTDGAEMKLTATGCRARTIISFFCATGDFESAPRLVHKSEDDCYHEIEWHTAAACPLSHKTGQNCRVFDDTAGYMFDLTPLTSNGSYAITGGDGYNYLLNVCDRVHDDHYCSSAPKDNAAICQVKLGAQNDVVKVAEPAMELEYFDGVLNLTYTHGESYHDEEHTQRMAEIAFLCDMKAGQGLPEFLDEKDFTYSFLWRTSYACPRAPVECVVTDENTQEQFDLSSLSKMSQNWQIEATHDPNNKKKFYINICRPLAPIPDISCSPFASVCASNIDRNGKESLFHGNLGRAVNSPTVEKSIHGVKLLYENGNICTDADGSTRNFKTAIHFSCVLGRVTGGPRAPVLISPCEYSILWETEAACPINNIETQDINGASPCTVKDPNSDFMFNLNPLAKSDGYEVKTADGDKSYKINFCHGLPETLCGKFADKYDTTVCEMGPNHSTSKAKLSTNLEYSSQGQLTLTYNGLSDASGAENKFVFNFFCERTTQSPVITYDSHFFLSTVFSVKTALACTAQPVSCIIQDVKGRQFDLSPLARETGNWIVIDTRPAHSDLHYHINVCRPVNPSLNVTCPGGAVGGCQTSTVAGQSFNMGYVQSQPVVSAVGDAITLHYEGGDKCHVGTNKEAHRSTRIIFFCDAEEHNPVFVNETSTCEYIFTWKTPSACPQHVVTGSNCKVTEPLYNVQFDLDSLRKSSDDYHVQGNGYDFLLNICGPLVNGAGACAANGVAACQTGSTLQEPIQIGLANSNLTYDSGQLSLVYTGGKGSCDKKFSQSTIINFVCDHNQTGNSTPEYVTEESDCMYTFEWHTSAACPPHHVTECTYQDGDNVYDLSRLSRADGNYERIYNASHVMYIVNVCRSLVHKKGQTCPVDAAACLIDLSQTDPKKKYHSIGQITSQTISYEQGTLILKYDHGEPCGVGKRKSTVLLFQCDETTDALGVPSNHFTKNECEEHFVWKSSAACPLKKIEDKTAANGFGDCKAANPDTGYVFDLRSLEKSEGYWTKDREGHEFALNVCGWLDSSSPCQNGTGSCQIEQTETRKGVSAGAANAQLLYRDGVLVLEYHGGDMCKENVPRTTIIYFVCTAHAGQGVPVYIDKSDDCIYYFNWHTELVCEKQVSCEVATDTGHTLDFSSLVKKTGMYNVLNTNVQQQQPGIVYINLCRPLNPIYGVLCPPGSGACLVKEGSKPKSLGHINTGPVYDKDLKEVRLTYSGGDKCDTNPKVDSSTVILLKCGVIEQQEPELDGYTSDCQYVIVWETPLACATNSQQKLTSECTYLDHRGQDKYDLSSLADQVDVKSSHGWTFHLKVCGQLEEKGEKGDASCAGSSVCVSGSQDRDGSFGDSRRGEFQKEENSVVLAFSGGRSCKRGGGSSQASSTIYFECDRSAEQGRPEIIDDDSNCDVRFRWKTSLVCPVDRKECLISKHGKFYDFTFLSQDMGSWNYTDSDQTVYWLNLCQSVHGSALIAGCPPEAAVCRKTPDGKVQMLGRLETQMMTTEDSSPTQTDILVQYTEGDTDICVGGRRRRSDLSPKVIIHLTCGNTVGAPVYLPHRPENTAKCIFEFRWKTKMACPVGSKHLPVIENNGKILDNRTQMVLDLMPLMRLHNMSVSVANKKYLINLGGPVQLGRTTTADSSACQDAAICQVSPDSKLYRNLGSYSSKTYYMQDDHLEVVFTSPEKCAGKQSKFNVTSTIIFNCKPGESVAEPEFLYGISDCAYVFSWDTSVVCLHVLPSVVQSPDDDSSDSVKHKSSSGEGVDMTKVVTGISICLAIVVVCILVLILHKAERRAALTFRLKNLVLCRKTQETPIVYSRLSQADHDTMAEEDGLDPFNPFNEPDEEAEINNSQLPTGVRSYHDDSDEDMLL